MNSKAEAKMKSKVDPKDQKKIDEINQLQKDLKSALTKAKGYTGSTDNDKSIYTKIETILDKIAKLTAS